MTKQQLKRRLPTSQFFLKSYSPSWMRSAFLASLILATGACHRVSFSARTPEPNPPDPTVSTLGSTTSTTLPGVTTTTMPTTNSTTTSSTTTTSSSTTSSTTTSTSTSTTTTVKQYVQCNTSLSNAANPGGVQSLSMTTADANPTVKAVCTPAGVNYTWSVQKNNAPVAVNGLQGAMSVPNMTALGAGTYKIILQASANGYETYTNASSPMTVTITDPVPPPTPVQCNPKMNGTQTSVTLNEGVAQPSLAANCQPASASCAWVVKIGTTQITIPGVSACNSSPDFSGQQPGTYNIYLTASAPNYVTYTTTNPLSVIIPAKTTRDVVTSKDVKVTDNQLDVLLVVDDSNSMLKDNQKLAAKLQGFVGDLSAAGFDWQMCVTVTHAQQLAANNPTLYWGASRYWVGNTGAAPFILKSGASNISKIFTDTINEIGAGWSGTDDERAIKAAWWHLWNGDVRYSDSSGCYRKDAGLAVIVLSDEDERSVGGDKSQQFYAGEYKPLDQDDQPQTYVKFVKEVFGTTKRFSVNSIIVQPGDSACMQAQDSEGSKSHFGYKYNELSQLTSGGTGSICASDFGGNLKYFKDQIVKDMASLPLECTPKADVKVTLTPNMTVTTRVENGSVYFTPKIPAGTLVKAEYKCAL